jgi:indolepyruvate ferredoxin oxidoreductase
METVTGAGEGSVEADDELTARLAGYQLTDRFRLEDGRVFLSGVQAVARLPADQLRIDRRAGLNTAAFVSGYQGSPVGTLREEVSRAARTVPDLPIVVRPGVNEELAATAVMGSQLADERPERKYDGVLGMWYAKAPGLDRACDAIRHAVFAGASPRGGVVAVVGDDPAAKSSTLPVRATPRWSTCTCRSSSLAMCKRRSISPVTPSLCHGRAASGSATSW